MPACIHCLNEVEKCYRLRGLCGTCQETQSVICYRCQQPFPHDNMVIINGDQPYCQLCHSFWHQFCDACGIPHDTPDMVHIDDIFYCTNCAHQNLLTCCECGDTSADFRPINLGIFCPSCLEEYIGCCHNCDCYCRLTDGGEYNTEDNNEVTLCYTCELGCITWPVKEFKPDQSNFNEIQSIRTFGIEIETSKCNRFSELKKDTIWGCTNDYSISGKEFITPPLYGDEGLKLIRDFCDTAHILGWEVDRLCGLHLHIGIKHLEANELKSLAYAYHITYGIWSQFVSDNRVDNSMCGKPSYPQSDITNININDLEGWEYFVAERDRFDAINWRAFLVHGTIELRLMDGTLSGELICNWIKAHVRFIDFVTKHTIDELDLLLDGDFYYQFTAITEIIGIDLANYYAHLASSHNNIIRHNEETLLTI